MQQIAKLAILDFINLMDNANNVHQVAMIAWMFRFKIVKSLIHVQENVRNVFLTSI